MSSLGSAEAPVGDTSLADRLGYDFGDPALLTLALTHRSWCAEHPGNESNERLEFLGDAVLGLAVTDHIYATYPDVTEGQLAKIRSEVVSAPSLARIGGALGIGRDLRLGKGEEASGGRAKQSILADATEAVLGAVYLDGGWGAARSVVLGLVADAVTLAASHPGTDDAKTRLQELAARLGLPAPHYVLAESGPDHDKRFTAVCSVDSTPLGEGSGTSKKQAEQHAARQACAVLLARLDSEGADA